MQLVIVSDFCRKIPYFNDITTWLNLSDDELCAFMDLVESEVVRYMDRSERVDVSIAKSSELVSMGQYTKEKEEAINKEIFEGPNPPNLVFRLPDITKAVSFLRSLCTREDFQQKDEGQDGGGRFSITYDVFPTQDIVDEVIECLPDWRGCSDVSSDQYWQSMVFWMYYEMMQDHIDAWADREGQETSRQAEWRTGKLQSGGA